jgi:hypothetical protein
MPDAGLAFASQAPDTYVQPSKLKQSRGGAMSNAPTNHGEGNPEAAEEFNQAEKRFVNSSEGKEKIAKGPQVRPEEKADLERAEQRGKSHAKNDDSKTTRMKR